MTQQWCWTPKDPRREACWVTNNLDWKRLDMVVNGVILKQNTFNRNDFTVVSLNSFIKKKWMSTFLHFFFFFFSVSLVTAVVHMRRVLKCNKMTVQWGFSLSEKGGEKWKGEKLEWTFYCWIGIGDIDVNSPPWDPKITDILVAMSTASVQILVSKYHFSIERNQVSSEKWQIPRTRSGKSQDSLEHFVVPESKKMLKDWWGHVKRMQRQLEGAPTG